ncbi:hypothetical protein CYMTET_42409 [Cymbomonas tetramitiformis]|uniref:Uncharacterized protein n=1 Tax=Cymbomonas tetramitiformis TaxID=36881 RepID=A0AAE0C656_9CHLO|nr:hypothetical protein CYMTET_42409 [Cymbomonas tetramitiformis]
MYDYRPTIRDPRNSERMTRSLSRELEFYAEMCAERVMRHDLKGSPCFIDHMNVDERAGLLLCFAFVIAKRADQLSSPVCVTNDERQQLRNLLKDGNAAALDGEIHVVRASVFAYSGQSSLSLGKMRTECAPNVPLPGRPFHRALSKAVREHASQRRGAPARVGSGWSTGGHPLALSMDAPVGRGKSHASNHRSGPERSAE